MIVEFAIVPLDRGESLSEYVSQVVENVDESGLDYKLTPMGTIVEGEWDEIMDLIKRCHKHVREVSKRVETRIVIDDREGAKGRIKGKVESVKGKLGKDLNT
ncbi:MAG: MTH1187 family thiamine-binding protein [Candidatus Saliniplasma sp.]